MEKELNKVIGERINTLLAKQSRKQKELAKHLGISDNIISYYVSGTRKPNIEQLIKIANFFSCTVDYLVGLAEVPTTDRDLEFVCDYTGLYNEAIDELQKLKDEEELMVTLNYLIESGFVPNICTMLNAFYIKLQELEKKYNSNFDGLYNNYNNEMERHAFLTVTGQVTGKDVQKSEKLQDLSSAFDYLTIAQGAVKVIFSWYAEDRKQHDRGENNGNN